MAIGYKILVPTSAKPALPMVQTVEVGSAALTAGRCYWGVMRSVAAESHPSPGMVTENVHRAPPDFSRVNNFLTMGMEPHG